MTSARIHRQFSALAAPLLGGALALAGVTHAGAARAQGRPDVQATADSDQVPLGETIDVTLRATTEGAAPSDPQIGRLPPAFHVIGASSSPSTSISITNGVRTDRRGLQTTWRLRADRIGTYAVGPSSVNVGGHRVEARAVTITVLDPTKGPPARNRPHFPPQMPFDPFQGLFDFGRDPAGDPFGMVAPSVPLEPRLALDSPRDRIAFLHATVDKPNAVVGEQVTFTVMLYVDTDVRQVEFTDTHDAQAKDFLSFPLTDQQTPADLGYTQVAGHVWTVRLVKRTALFPLQAGDLEIGPLTGVVGTGRGSSLGPRLSETLHVHATEPPLAGRPPGYASGDVGTFALAAEVTPRTVERGGAIGVTVVLSGTGNLPAAITPPQKPGVEWLDPEMHQALGPTAGGERFGGKRTFAYVVRLQNPGDVDLGEFALPYWDPQRKGYAVARAPLGSVHVNPGLAGAQAAGAAEENDPFAGLPSARVERSPAAPKARHLTDTPWVWGGLGTPTFAFVIFAVGRRTARTWRARGPKPTSPRAEAKARAEAADLAARGTDASALDGATARALEAATVARTGAPLHRTANGQLARLLEEHGVPGDLASQIEALSTACTSARFSGGSDLADARERWKEARAAIARLGGPRS